MLLYLLGIVIILMENIIVLISFNGCYNFFFLELLLGGFLLEISESLSILKEIVLIP